MIGLWMAYCLITGVLLACLTWLLEQVFRLKRWPTRGVWACAMGAMLLSGVAAVVGRGDSNQAVRAWEATAAPIASKFTSSPQSDARPTSTSAKVFAFRAQIERARALLDPVLVEQRRLLDPWNTVLLEVWALLSALLGAALLLALSQSRRLRRGLETRMVGDTIVLLTDDVGPAAAGARASAVLLPRWVFELDAALLTLVLRHEREHIAARDPLLLLGSVVAVVFAPWHLPLWWASQRLRLAVEVDCDGRVLRAHPDVRRYAQLLLLTSQRAVGARWASPFITSVVAPLQPLASHLVRRIAVMTQPRHTSSFARASLMIGGAALVAVAAVALPVPRADASNLRTKAAQAVVAPGRITVRVATVGIDGVQFAGDTLKNAVLVFSTGRGRVGLGNATPVTLTDTLRLHRLPQMTADVTDGDVHIELTGPGQLVVGGDVTNGLASHYSATGRRIVLLKDGEGVTTR